jgi:hypothetical protein
LLCDCAGRGLNEDPGRIPSRRKDSGASVVAWSAGVSAAGAGIAALFADGTAGWRRALFVIFVATSGIAFVILMAAGLRGLVFWFWRRDDEDIATASSPRSPDSDPPAQEFSTRAAQDNVTAQDNEITGAGTLFGVLDGRLIINEGDAGPPLPEPPGRRPTGPTPGRNQRNVVSGNGQLFAANGGDIYLYRLAGKHSPEDDPDEGQQSDEH